MLCNQAAAVTLDGQGHWQLGISQLVTQGTHTQVSLPACSKLSNRFVSLRRLVQTSWTRSTMLLPVDAPLSTLMAGCSTGSRWWTPSTGGGEGAGHDSRGAAGQVLAGVDMQCRLLCIATQLVYSCKSQPWLHCSLCCDNRHIPQKPCAPAHNHDTAADTLLQCRVLHRIYLAYLQSVHFPCSALTALSDTVAELYCNTSSERHAAI